MGYDRSSVAHLRVEHRALQLIGRRESLLRLTPGAQIPVLHLHVAASPRLPLGVRVLRHLEQRPIFPLHDRADAKLLDLARARASRSSRREATETQAAAGRRALPYHATDATRACAPENIMRNMLTELDISF